MFRKAPLMPFFAVEQLWSSINRTFTSNRRNPFTFSRFSVFIPENTEAESTQHNSSHYFLLLWASDVKQINTKKRWNYEGIYLMNLKQIWSCNYSVASRMVCVIMTRFLFPLHNFYPNENVCFEDECINFRKTSLSSNFSLHSRNH